MPKSCLIVAKATKKSQALRLCQAIITEALTLGFCRLLGGLLRRGFRGLFCRGRGCRRRFAGLPRRKVRLVDLPPRPSASAPAGTSSVITEPEPT